MHTEKREDPLVELGYEVRDINSVAIRNATIGFFLFGIASAIIGFGAYRFMNPTVFEKHEAARRILPPAGTPMVQSNIATKVDIMELRQHETLMLTSPVGWADEQKTHLHMPIDQAMKLIAQKGVTPTGSEVPAVSKGHAPDPAIGEKPKPATTVQVVGTAAGKSSASAPTATTAAGAPKGH